MFQQQNCEEIIWFKAVLPHKTIQELEETRFSSLSPVFRYDATRRRALFFKILERSWSSKCQISNSNLWKLRMVCSDAWMAVVQLSQDHALLQILPLKYMTFWATLCDKKSRTLNLFPSFFLSLPELVWKFSKRFSLQRKWFWMRLLQWKLRETLRWTW